MLRRIRRMRMYSKLLFMRTITFIVLCTLRIIMRMLRLRLHIMLRRMVLLMMHTSLYPMSLMIQRFPHRLPRIMLYD